MIFKSEPLLLSNNNNNYSKENKEKEIRNNTVFEPPSISTIFKKENLSLNPNKNQTSSFFSKLEFNGGNGIP
jgi:hypothetical protein